MANLTEVSNFDAGVYRIETTDAVIGGENGISNKSAKNLANRTKWLKDQITTILASLSIDEAAIDDYATRIALIETSKVQDIGTNFADGVVVLAPAPTATVNGADVRKLNIVDLGNLNCTITLPALSGFGIGSIFSFAVIASNGTYSTGKTGFIGAGSDTILGPSTNFYIGDVVSFTKKSATVWIVSNIYRSPVALQAQVDALAASRVDIGEQTDDVLRSEYAGTPLLDTTAQEILSFTTPNDGITRNYHLVLMCVIHGYNSGTSSPSAFGYNTTVKIGVTTYSSNVCSIDAGDRITYVHNAIITNVAPNSDIKIYDFRNGGTTGQIERSKLTYMGFQA